MGQAIGSANIPAAPLPGEVEMGTRGGRKEEGGNVLNELVVLLRGQPKDSL